MPPPSPSRVGVDTRIISDPAARPAPFPFPFPWPEPEMDRAVVAVDDDAPLLEAPPSGAPLVMLPPWGGVLVLALRPESRRGLPLAGLQ